MKKSLVLLLMTGLSLSYVHAQDDDVYFIPSDEKKPSVKVKENAMRSTYTDITDENAGGDYDNWADGRTSNRNIDEYNRRGENYNTEVTPDELRDYIKETLAIREPFYQKAKHTIQIEVLERKELIDQYVNQICQEIW